jgi:ATP-binding cassette subfamily C (CFTR/MRP) protein 1
MEARAERRKFPSIYGSNASSISIDSNSDKNSEDSQKDGLSVELCEMNSLGSQAVVIENGLFGWDKDKPSGILQGISMIVPRGKITMVVGPVGCGKSTLLKAVLGELPVMGGTLQLSSLRIALCDQTAWHVNGTVQQSITGSSAYDLRWYSSVVRSCALDEDLRQLPQGDQTQIGSKGIALSGGQSQRIVRHPVHPTLSPPPSLTHHPYRRLRERYMRKRTSLSLMTVSVGLMAILRTRYGTVSSAVTAFLSDAGVLFSLRRHQVSQHYPSLTLDRVLLTLLVLTAKRLPYCDHIVALSKEGKIAEQGHFEKLNAAGGYVSSFNLAPPDWEVTTEKHEYDAPPRYTEQQVDNQVTEEDIQAEANRRTGDIAIYRYYVGSVGWIPTIVFIVSCSIFIFGISFPCKYRLLLHYRHY